MCSMTFSILWASISNIGKSYLWKSVKSVTSKWALRGINMNYLFIQANFISFEGWESNLYQKLWYNTVTKVTFEFWREMNVTFESLREMNITFESLSEMNIIVLVKLDLFHAFQSKGIFFKNWIVLIFLMIRKIEQNLIHFSLLSIFRMTDFQTYENFLGASEMKVCLIQNKFFHQT